MLQALTTIALPKTSEKLTISNNFHLGLVYFFKKNQEVHGNRMKSRDSGLSKTCLDDVPPTGSCGKLF
jgi:hypothetical protein